VVSALVAMLVLSWRLTLVALVLMPVFIALQVRVGRVRRRIAGQTQGSMADMTAITQETLSVSGVLLAKVFDRQRAEVERYSAENARQADLQVRQTMTGQSFFALVQAFFGLTPSLVYLVAGLSIAGVFLAGGATTLTAGTIVAFTTLQTRLLFPVVQLLRVGVEVQTSLALFERIFSYLDLSPSIVDRPDATSLSKAEVAGHVGFERVYFRYSGGDRADADGQQPWTLHDVTLDIPAGQLVAFVGPSGAGKTTASYLVPRLYDVDDGRVTLDGHDVRDLAQSTLAATIGVVTQESYLFHATVRDNLRYARQDATDDELEAAARAAYIHDRIERLENGYDTTVGERGYRLSGGEKQRLAIARVILADPRVLILDEATSALDTASERLVQQALETVMQGRTTIAIAHRLSTVLAADQIFVLERGRVVERGSHGELLARGGLYAKLYDEQFGGGRVQARCDDARLSYFLNLLPPWMRVAVEFRHPSWLHDDLFALLECHQVGYCVMSGAHLPCVLRTTAPFVYVRLHGPDHDHLYGGSYSDDDLAWWADRVREWADAGRDVFVYFNNDGHGHAVRNAETLRALVG